MGNFNPQMVGMRIDHLQPFHFFQAADFFTKNLTTACCNEKLVFLVQPYIVFRYGNSDVVSYHIVLLFSFMNYFEISSVEICGLTSVGLSGSVAHYCASHHCSQSVFIIFINYETTIEVVAAQLFIYSIKIFIQEPSLTRKEETSMLTEYVEIIATLLISLIFTVFSISCRG